MELKGVKPGRFHPRCTACRGKFVLQISANPNEPPMVGAEHDPSAETISPVIAHALGVPNSPAPVAAPNRQVSTTQVARTLAETMPATPSVVPTPASERASVAASTQATLAHAPAPAPAPIAPPRPSPDTSFHDDAGAAPYTDAGDQVTPGLTLGGYEIQQKLGEGGMGAVYLARQVSLDRNVALKVLSPFLARDPQFVARFTREAYAAAQLTHHNVVQIHDIGAERETHFFSMEFVEGQTLSKLVDEHGKVDIEQAVGFVLQAARGLKYAHDHGLIHRDIKPENLLLNDQGIVKVADLGLVKRAGANETISSGTATAGGPIDRTQANMSMGTPAYMAPEQAEDAAAVDQRADIYSLGCTLYDLLTGRPPFTGETAVEIITKHQREAVVPPELIVRNIPKTISTILMKMVAKRPEQRFQTMGEVIRAMEDFLGVATTGPFTPKEEHVKVLEFAVERFNASKWARIRKLVIGVFYLACIALAIFVGMTRTNEDHAIAVLRKVQWTGAFVGLAILTTLAYQITVGLTQRTPIFLKFRQLVFGANLTDWLMWVFVLALAGTALVVFKQHVPWLIVVGIAVLLAAAFHFTVDLALNRDRAKPISQVEQMLKDMRLRGLEENALRQFVCNYSGKHWEAFYEALFGYEAKLQARTLWGKSERGQLRPRYGAWRDPIIRGIEMRLSARRESRERRLLAKVEAKALKAKGFREDIARKQAKRNADALVSRAEKLRSTKASRAAKTMTALPTQASTPASAAPAQPQSVMINKDAALEGAIAAILHSGSMKGEASGEGDDEWERVHESWFKRRYGTPLDLVFSQIIRFALAMVVLAGFTIWFKQQGGADAAARETAAVVGSRREIDFTGQVKDIRGNIIRAGSDIKTAGEKVVEKTGTQPLRLFPERWTTLNRWFEPFGGWNAGLAGVLLLLSVFFVGKMMGLLVMISALVSMWGYRFELPVIGFQPYPWMAAIAAILLWLFAVIFFRHREGY